MVRRVGEDRLYLRNRQPEIGCDVGFIDASFPILNDFIDRHTRALEYRASTLHARFHFDEWAI